MESLSGVSHSHGEQDGSTHRKSPNLPSSAITYILELLPEVQTPLGRLTLCIECDALQSAGDDDGRGLQDQCHCESQDIWALLEVCSHVHCQFPKLFRSDGIPGHIARSSSSLSFRNKGRAHLISLFRPDGPLVVSIVLVIVVVGSKRRGEANMDQQHVNT